MEYLTANFIKFAKKIEVEKVSNIKYLPIINF